MNQKIISLLLTGIMTLTGVSFVFADTSFSDVTGTPYETAVVKLVSSDVLSGYEDGTFRPENPITRAEACVIVTKAMKASSSDLNTAFSQTFSDVTAGFWASSYINYAASKKIISGYTDGTFGPDRNVTYYEMAAMLINAMGKQASLTGQWPENYYNKASEEGIWKDIVLEGSFDGNASATRGNVAIMTQAVLTEIIQANNIKTEQSDPTAGFGNTDQVSTGDLKDLDGRAYGIIIGCSDVKTKTGSTVQKLTFLYNGKTEYAVTRTANTFDGTYRTDGSLDCLQMSDGIVQSVTPATQTTSNFKEFNVPGGYTSVLGITNRLVSISCGGTKTDFTIANDAAFYVANGTTFYPGSLSDVKVGAQVRLYTVNGATSATGPVEVVIVKPAA